MRVVSLVPSLTETLLTLGLPLGDLVGRTAFCVHPATSLRDVQVVGGTKNPNLGRLLALAPDLVVLDREENRRETFEALEAAGIRTFVSEVTSVDHVPPMLVELGEAIERVAVGRALADRIVAARALASAAPSGPLAVPLIWNEPLMAVAPHRYSGDLVRCAGFRVPEWPDSNGYPKVTPQDLCDRGVEVLLLTSEPHDFTMEEGNALAGAMEAIGGAPPRVLKVDGEALTWFGCRTAAALTAFTRLAATLR